MDKQFTLSANGNDFKKDDLITIIGISDFMGNTTRSVVKFTGDVSSDGKPIFKDSKKGSRKTFTLRPFKNDTLVFVGDVPFKIDGDISKSDGAFTSTTIRGNACLNLVGDPVVIKDWIMNKNINQVFDKHDYVLLIDGDKEISLFPEIPTSHAIIQRARAATPAAIIRNEK